MHQRSASAIVFCALLIGVLVAPAGAAFDPNDYDVYKNGVPDVDKVPLPPAPGDNSCWQATAANLLGGAGYGLGGAQGIYNQLTNDLGKNNLGATWNAVNYWLYTYGKNPNSPEFQPNNAYTDVTVKERYAAGLTVVDYNFLLDELKRCQYVGVGFDIPPHCMTLVGGDYENAVPPGSTTKSVWHDSDITQAGGNGNDVYINDFATHFGQWDLATNVFPPPVVDYEQKAQTYTVLCPGLNKPLAAMMNYDVAYFMNDPTKTADWAPGFRVAGEMGSMYPAPMWDPLEPNQTVIIGNEYIKDKYKEVWLLVDYKDRDPNRAEQIILIDDAGKLWSPTSVTDSNDGGQSLYYWELDYQPHMEKIVFPNDAYMTLTDYVKDWDVSTICVPEPCTVALLGMGAMVLFRRRKRA